MIPFESRNLTLTMTVFKADIYIRKRKKSVHCVKLVVGDKFDWLLVKCKTCYLMRFKSISYRSYDVIKFC